MTTETVGVVNVGAASGFTRGILPERVARDTLAVARARFAVPLSHTFLPHPRPTCHAKDYRTAGCCSDWSRVCRGLGRSRTKRGSREAVTVLSGSGWSQRPRLVGGERSSWMWGDRPELDRGERHHDGT